VILLLHLLVLRVKIPSESLTRTSDLLTSESANNWESPSDPDMTLIIIVVIVGALFVSVLIVLVVIIVRRRKSNSEPADNSVSMTPLASDSNIGNYSRIDRSDSSYHSIPRNGNGSANEGEKPSSFATKSWELNYSELQLLEKVGEGAFGTVHRAIFRHQQVAVKQLKNQIDQREVCIQHHLFMLTSCFSWRTLKRKYPC
jgi:hypothetical protein